MGAKSITRPGRVPTADPATGIFRHLDAGYERAEEIAAERGVKVPGR